jgi:hypothetical protein
MGRLYHKVRTLDTPLNIVRKIALNCVKNHKQKLGLKSPLAKIMLYCLIDPDDLLSVLASFEN